MGKRNRYFHFFLITALILAFVFTGMALASCGASDTETKESASGDSTETTYDGPTISLVENGVPRFQIVRSDLSSNELTTASVNLKKAIGDIADGQVKIGTDAADRQGNLFFPEEEYEILLGDTTRSASQEALKDLETGYIIKVMGTKIVIAGTSDHMTCLAIQWFMDHYLSDAKASGEIPQNLSHTFVAEKMYTFTLNEGNYDKYDQCVTAIGLQGIFNREHEGEKLYIISKQVGYSKTYLSEEWVSTFDTEPVSSLQDLLTLVSPYLKAIVIWDTEVPATLNAATTIAGVEDAVIFTEGQYKQYASKLPEIQKVISLVDKFDGSVTGSAKNDVYQWMISEYLDTGKCSLTHLFSFEDSWSARGRGDVRYLVCRDKAIFHRGFVYDLSIWQDEAPKDDPNQPLASDYNTYVSILKSISSQRGEETLTEVDGFYNSGKYSDSGNDDTFTSKYKPTHVEWEVVYTFTPYGCFWNPVTESACNRTVHMTYELEKRLWQSEPHGVELNDSDDQVYLLMIMGDYDAAGSFYTKFYDNWNDSGRGKIPLAWAVNPNLLDDYPDLIESAYQSKTDNDYFVANGGAGWYNPSRVKESMWPVYLAQHQKYFNLTDMTIAADIWDYQAPSQLSASFITKYSTDGIGMLIANMLRRGTGTKLYQHIDSKSGVVMDPIYNYFTRNDINECAKDLAGGVKERLRPGHATFMMTRAVWSTPTYVMQCLDKLKTIMPDKTFHVVDPYDYFRLLEESLKKQ